MEKRIEQLLYWGTAAIVVAFMLTGVYFLWIRSLVQWLKNAV